MLGLVVPSHHHPSHNALENSVSFDCACSGLRADITLLSVAMDIHVRSGPCDLSRTLIRALHLHFLHASLRDLDRECSWHIDRKSVV